jgi:hypothetical protein
MGGPAPTTAITQDRSLSVRHLSSATRGTRSSNPLCSSGESCANLPARSLMPVLVLDYLGQGACGTHGAAAATLSVIVGATLDAHSAGLMATRFRPTQTTPTAFTPLAGRDGEVSHPYWARMDRCVDYIWISDGIEILASEVCFNRPSPDDPSLWPSDHAGVWADLRICVSVQKVRPGVME